MVAWDKPGLLRSNPSTSFWSGETPDRLVMLVLVPIRNNIKQITSPPVCLTRRTWSSTSTEWNDTCHFLNLRRLSLPRSMADAVSIKSAAIWAKRPEKTRRLRLPANSRPILRGLTASTRRYCTRPQLLRKEACGFIYTQSMAARGGT